MKAKELIDILALNPNGEIVTLHTQYDGGSDVTTWEDCQVVTDGETFVLASTNCYDKYAAIENLTALSVGSRAIAEMAKSTDPCIYVD